jgi:DNA-binding NarL/FixJ family response regulator
MSRQVLRGLLVEAGFEVVGEVDMAVSALDLVTVTRPDVLVVDVNMPGLSGADIVRDVNERCPDTAVIVVSAFDVDHLERIDIGEAVILPKTDLVRFDEVLAEVANKGSASTA